MSRASEFKKKLGAAGKMLTVASEQPKPEELSGWPFPSAQLNYMITGDPTLGLCRGRLYEVYGPEASGKSTLCLQVCEEVVRQDGIAVFIDMEHKIHLPYVRMLGMDMDNFLLMQPKPAPKGKPQTPLCAEEVFEAAPVYARNGADVIVVDSLPRMWPRSYLDCVEFGKEEMAVRAKSVEKLLRVLMSLMDTESFAAMVINRISSSFNANAPETTLCGQSPRFDSSCRIRLARCTLAAEQFRGDLGGLNNSSKDVLGSLTRAAVKKNSIGIPLRQVKIPIFFGSGFDYMYDSYLFAARTRLITRSRQGGVPGFKVGGEWVVDDPYYKDGRAQMAEKWPEVLQLLCDAAADDGFKSVSEEEEIVVDEETGEVLEDGREAD